MEEKTWKLYKYTCIPNGLIYFGITCKTLDERWANGNGYRSNSHLDRCIKLYGEKNFIKEIILENLTFEEACNKEIEYIEKYNATDKNIGFNISRGGTAPMYGRKHSSESCKKFSETRKGEQNGFYGKHHTEKTKEILREKNLGKKHSEEWKQEQSARAKEWHKTHENPMKDNHRFAGKNNPMYGIRGGEHPASVAVCQYDLNGNYIQTFSSIVEANKALGIKHSHISDCCNGLRKKCKGYIWKYANKEFNCEVKFIDEGEFEQ